MLTAASGDNEGVQAHPDKVEHEGPLEHHVAAADDGKACGI